MMMAHTQLHTPPPTGLHSPQQSTSYPSARTAVPLMSPSPRRPSNLPGRHASRLPRASPSRRRASGPGDIGGGPSSGTQHHLGVISSSRRYSAQNEVDSELDVENLSRTPPDRQHSPQTTRTQTQTRTLPRANTVLASHRRVQRGLQTAPNTPSKQQQGQPKEHVAAASPAAAAAARRAPSRAMKMAGLPVTPHRGALPDRISGRTPLTSRNGRQVDLAATNKASPGDVQRRRRANTENLDVLGSFSQPSASPRRTSAGCAARGIADRVETETAAALPSSRLSCRTSMSSPKKAPAMSTLDSFRQSRQFSYSPRGFGTSSSSQDKTDSLQYLNDKNSTYEPSGVTTDSVPPSLSACSRSVNSDVKGKPTGSSQITARPDLSSGVDKWSEYFSSFTPAHTDLLPSSAPIPSRSSDVPIEASEFGSCTVSSDDGGGKLARVTSTAPPQLRYRASERFSLGNLNLDNIERLSKSVGRRRSRGASGGPCDYPADTPTPSIGSVSLAKTLDFAIATPDM